MAGQVASSALLCSLAEMAQNGACAPLLAQLTGRTCTCALLGARRQFAAPALSAAAGALDDAQQAERRASHHGASASQHRSLHSTSQPQVQAQVAVQPQQHHHYQQQHSVKWRQPAFGQQSQWHQQPGAVQAVRDDIELQELLERQQQEARRQQELRRQRALEGALAAAPDAARPVLRALAAALALPPAALAELAAAAHRSAKQVHLKRVGWLDAAAARALVAKLQSGAALDAAGAAQVLTRCVALLRAVPGADPCVVVDALRRYAYPGGGGGVAESSGDSSSSGGGRGGGGGGGNSSASRSSSIGSTDLGQLLLRAPTLLRTPPAAVESNLRYLARTLQLPPDAVRRALSAHPALASHREGAMAINMGFLVGLGATGADLRAMMGQCPRWATMPLRDLTVKWQFFRQELKGTVEDLVLAPQLLQLSLLDTLGPRAGLAKKKRIKLLMPSYSAGHPILKRPREWAQHRMAPVAYWMTAPPARLGKTMGLDPDEAVRYQEAWKMTTGDRWRRLVLSPTAAGGGGAAEGAGGGAGAEAGPQLVTLPQGARDDEGRGFGAIA